MNIRIKVCSIFLLFVIGGLVYGGGASEKSGKDVPLRIYSTRHYQLDEKIVEMFTEETGIEVEVLSGKDIELIERLSTEGTRSNADLFWTTGAESIYRATQADVLAPLAVDKLVDYTIPSHLYGDTWVSITKRARIIYYNKDTVDPVADGVQTYWDLAKPALADSILVRSSSSNYNQALVASMIAHRGVDATKTWAKGVVKNLARQPQGNDRDQLRALASGMGRYAIANTYYTWLLANSDNPDDAAVMKKIGAIFPKGKDGAHVNVSAAGLTKYAKSPQHAQRFLSFILSTPIQTLFAETNGEYSVNPNVAPVDFIANLGTLSEDTIPLSSFGEHREEAITIFKDVNWQ